MPKRYNRYLPWPQKYAPNCAYFSYKHTPDITKGYAIFVAIMQGIVHNCFVGWGKAP